MSRPDFVSRVKANDFYNNPAYTCPKCGTRLKIDMEPEMVLASDVMFDQCPDCGTQILVNMLHEEERVVIEGYSDVSRVLARQLELAKVYKERHSRCGSPTSTEKECRSGELPWWKRLFR